MELDFLEQAYDKAVVAMLNATGCTPDQAEHAVQAIAELVFATINAELPEDKDHATNH